MIIAWVTETVETKLLPSSGCWKSEDQISAWAGSAKGPCIGCLSQDLENQGPTLAHGLRGSSPSWPGGHVRVQDGRKLRLGLLTSQQNRYQGEGIIALLYLSFKMYVIQSSAQPIGHNHTSSLPS